MSIQGVLPPIVQMGYVEKIAELEQNQPAVQQAVSQEIAREALQRQNSQVSAVDNSDRSRKVGDREAGQEKRRREGKKRADSNDAGVADGEEGREEQVFGPADNPFAGKIVNVKI